MEVINVPFIFAILSVCFLAIFLIYQKLQKGKSLDKIRISYSEKVGDSIIEHDKQYEGFIDYKEDTIKIPALKLIRPVPPRNVFVGTNTGKMKLYIIRIDSDRYGYRIPKLTNSILLEKRDIEGNIIKGKNGKPIVIKYQWQLCDDVVEPDVKHWEQHIEDKLREKHKTKMDLLAKWIGAAVVGMILLAGIITIQMTVKFASSTFKEMETLSSQTAAKVEQNAGLVNSIIKRIDEDQKTQNNGAGNSPP